MFSLHIFHDFVIKRKRKDTDFPPQILIHFCSDFQTNILQVHQIIYRAALPKITPQWQNCTLCALSNMIATNHMWLFNNENMANSKKQKFILLNTTLTSTGIEGITLYHSSYQI